MSEKLCFIDGYLRAYNGATGAFVKFKCKGKYLPGEINHTQPFDQDAYYDIRPVKASDPLPTKDMKLRVYFAKGDAWVDERTPEKKIIRVKVSSYEKRGDLDPKPEAEPTEF